MWSCCVYVMVWVCGVRVHACAVHYVMYSTVCVGGMMKRCACVCLRINVYMHNTVCYNIVVCYVWWWRSLSMYVHTYVRTYTYSMYVLYLCMGPRFECKSKSKCHLTFRMPFVPLTPSLHSVCGPSFPRDCSPQGGPQVPSPPNGTVHPQQGTKEPPGTKFQRRPQWNSRLCHRPFLCWT